MIKIDNLFNDITYEFAGFFGKMLENHQQNWARRALADNPSVLLAIEKGTGFYKKAHPDFNIENEKPFVAWYGEFSGKFLEGLSYFYSIRNNEEVKKIGDGLVDTFAKIQGDDGYLGVYIKEKRFCSSSDNWDPWNHYHIISGLIKWYFVSKNEKALIVALKASDYMLEFLKSKNGKLFESSFTMNLSVSHIFAIIYTLTGNKDYLSFAIKMIGEDWVSIGGNWFNNAIDGIDYYKSTLPRWESLHAIETLGILYSITTEKKYFIALEQIWKSITKTDIHNSGGFTTDEAACGNPYKSGIIETCCTVSYQALTTEYLRLKPQVFVADEAEKTFLNAMLGSFLIGDAIVTYNTPMNAEKGGAYDGRRIDSRIDLAFQYYEGSADFNCCQANATRGLSEIAKWSVMLFKDEIFINSLLPYKCKVITLKGEFEFIIKSDYPSEREIKLIILNAPKTPVKLNLRIPTFSKSAEIMVLDEKTNCVIGDYFKTERVWKANDEIKLKLNYHITSKEGEKELTGQKCFFYGNILLAIKKISDEDIIIDESFIPIKAPNANSLVRFKFKDSKENDIYLQDFFSVGRAEERAVPPSYKTWFKTI